MFPQTIRFDTVQSYYFSEPMIAYIIDEKIGERKPNVFLALKLWIPEGYIDVFILLWDGHFMRKK